jgi:hypothetical protein
VQVHFASRRLEPATAAGNDDGLVRRELVRHLNEAFTEYEKTIVVDSNPENRDPITYEGKKFDQVESELERSWKGNV